MAKLAPVAPEWLAEEAKAEWARVLSCHRVTERERGLLAAYCQAWARWHQAETAIERDGTEIVIRDSRGMVKSVLASPNIGISARAHGQLVKAAIELGLTTGRRGVIAKVPSASGKPEETVASGWFDDLATPLQ